MNAKNVIIILIFFWCVGCTGCISNVEKETIIDNNITPFIDKNVTPLTELDKLIQFLEEDKTNKRVYYDDNHRGMDYFVCSGFTRALGENASKYNVTTHVLEGIQPL